MEHGQIVEQSTHDELLLEEGLTSNFMKYSSRISQMKQFLKKPEDGWCHKSR